MKQKISFSTRENLKSDLTEYYNLIYQYENDCLIASIEYQKDYYNDSEIRPSENIFVNLTIIPFGTTNHQILNNEKNYLFFLISLFLLIFQKVSLMKKYL